MPVDAVVKVFDVVVPRKRMRIANHVEDLAASIDKNGLLHPITLRRDGERLILVAGRRRLEAMKLLRVGEIRARIIDATEVEALLIEIDENLQREELTELQRSQHIAERKKIWEALNPHAKHGGAAGNKGKSKGKAPRSDSKDIKDADSASLIGGKTFGDRRAPSFVKATAMATKSAPRTVAESAQIGTNLCPEAQNLLEGTPVEDRKTDLLNISRLGSKDQVAVAQTIKDGKASNFSDAKRLAVPEKSADVPAKKHRKPLVAAPATDSGIPPIPGNLVGAINELARAALLFQQAFTAVDAGEDPAEVRLPRYYSLQRADLVIGRWRDHLRLDNKEILDDSQ